MNPRAAARAGYAPPLGDQILFYVLAAWVTVFALFTITRRNPVTAVMSLVGDVLRPGRDLRDAVAHFLAVLQVLVYAGAIMVLFIFVVMILNREEVAPLALRPMRLLGVAAARLPAGRVRERRSRDRRADDRRAAGRRPRRYGTVASIGDILFREFLFPFEAISLLLLVAIVGGVVVSRSHQKEVAATRAADYRKQVEELADQRLPGRRRVTSRRRRAEGITDAMPDRPLPDPVVRAVPDRDGRRAAAPQRAHRADGHRAAAQRRQPGAARVLASARATRRATCSRS